MIAGTNFFMFIFLYRTIAKIDAPIQPGGPKDKTNRMLTLYINQKGNVTPIIPLNKPTVEVTNRYGAKPAKEPAASKVKIDDEPTSIPNDSASANNFSSNSFFLSSGSLEMISANVFA